jgi:hypothetical protein
MKETPHSKPLAKNKIMPAAGLLVPLPRSRLSRK